MEPGQKIEGDADKWQRLLQYPTKELWLWDLQLCFAGEHGRRIQYEHVPNLAERYRDIIGRISDKDGARNTLVLAIEQVLKENSPVAVSSDTNKSSMLLDLVGDFTPPSGFDWIVQLMNDLGMPKSGTSRLTGKE